MRPRKLTEEQKDEIVRLYREGLSMLEVADRLSVSYTTIWHLLDHKGEKKRPKGGVSTLREEQQKEIIKLYSQGLTSPAIADMFAVSKNTIIYVLECQGIKRRPAGGKRKLTEAQEKEIVRLYDERLSPNAIADRFSVGTTTIGRVLERQGRKRRPLGWHNRGKSKLAEEQKEEIIRLYDEGLSTRALADRLPVSHETIRRTLHLRGRKRRTISEALRKLTKEQEQEVVRLYNEGLSENAIADKYPVSRTTIWEILNRNEATKRDPIEALRQVVTLHTHDATFFDIIDTEEKAYWIGFIMADGCVHKKSSDFYILSVALQKSDVNHLVKLKDSLHSSHLIREGKIGCSLKINSTGLCKALISHGVVPRKSWEELFPPQMPDELLRHFWRGYFDGDGSLHEQKQRTRKDGSAGRFWVFGLAGSRKLLESFMVWAWSQGLLARRPTIRHIRLNCKTLQIALGRKSDVHNVTKALYEDAKIYLDRKMETYQRCKKHIETPKTIRLLLCTVKGCGNCHHARGYCRKHYKQAWRRTKKG